MGISAMWNAISLVQEFGLVSPCPFPTTITITPRAPPLNNLMVRLQSWSFGNVEYPFIAITPWSTLTQIGSTWLDPIYGSNYPLLTSHLFSWKLRIQKIFGAKIETSVDMWLIFYHTNEIFRLQDYQRERERERERGGVGWVEGGGEVIYTIESSIVKGTLWRVTLHLRSSHPLSPT